MQERHDRAWWLGLTVLWALATAADRLWLASDARLPSWDQAEYLNAAVSHGRALGLLPPGSWQGWDSLLDLSPKIPPLASLANGAVMRMAGSGPDQAAWALALWHGLLLLVVGGWGRQLAGGNFGLLAAALVALTPSLAAQRVDFTLDLPLAAATSLALWQLGRWQAPPPRGGRWSQALTAALALATALLVKQSALLVLALPGLWAAARGLAEPRRRPQALLGLAVVVTLLLPWLRHNWITAIGGTNRAVFESGAAEGDPPPLSLASLLWYPRRAAELLGPVLPLPAVVAAALAAWRWRQRLPDLLRHPVRHLPPGWGWLIGCTLSGWLVTSLSPNKDLRYFSPVLPPLLLLVALGWWEIGRLVRRRWGRRWAAASLGAGLAAGLTATVSERVLAIEAEQGSPLVAVVAEVRRAVGEQPTTVVVLPSRPALNQHNVTTFGRQDGGGILGREAGKRREEHSVVLERSRWIVLGEGDLAPSRKASKELGRRVRSDPRFMRVGTWTSPSGGTVELWRRRQLEGPGGPARFDADFIRLARGMERGPAGLVPLFDRIGIEHQLDAPFAYQERVETWARARLARDADDRDALWSLALLATLRNRPAEAEGWYARLERLEPENPWPSAYRAVVLLAGWNPWKARSVLADAAGKVEKEPVLRGLRDLSTLLSGNPLALPALRHSLPAAVRAVENDLAPE